MANPKGQKPQGGQDPANLAQLKEEILKSLEIELSDLREVFSRQLDEINKTLHQNDQDLVRRIFELQDEVGKVQADVGNAGKVQVKAGAGPARKVIGLLEPIPPGHPERDNLLSMGKKVDGDTLNRIMATVKEEKSQLKIRSVVIHEAFPGGRTKKHLAVVRSVIAGAGGAAHLRRYKGLTEAILYDVYATNKVEDLDESDVREFAARAFKNSGEAIYKERIKEVIESLGGMPADKEVQVVFQILFDQKIPLDSPQLTIQVAKALETARRESEFEHFFKKNGVDLEKELDNLPRERVRRAIHHLESIGLDPTKATDDDWGRIALGLTGSDISGLRHDALSIAGFGGLGGSVVDFSDFEPNFPDFETDVNIGLIAENIRTCADLYYIHQFGRMGIFDVMRAVARRFFEDINLGQTETAAKLYRHIKLIPVRFPEKDWMEITDSLFEEGPFKALMGRMVEALVDYAKSRNAGEFFLNTGQEDRISSTYTRSAVIRSIQNLQRYLSERGGGITHFIRSEVGSELMEIFDILGSDDLQRYYGGSFRSGMFAIIEQEGRAITGETPPVDRNRTLAVFGRCILKWLADNTANSSVLTDADLAELIDYVDQWLAAYRRPTMEPDWLSDDDEYTPEDETEEMVEEAVREAVEPEEMDILSQM